MDNTTPQVSDDDFLGQIECTLGEVCHSAYHGTVLICVGKCFLNVFVFHLFNMTVYVFSALTLMAGYLEELLASKRLNVLSGLLLVWKNVQLICIWSS